MVLDTPLSNPACHKCKLDCPGVEKCPEESVTQVKSLVTKVIAEDEKLRDEHPKTYEIQRNQADEYDHTRDILGKDSTHHILSRPFKRRLKKPYLPYWNRPIDVWMWFSYYDQMLELFNITYDSFGNSSLMIQSRLSYLKRHFPKDLSLYESHTAMILIELLKSKIIYQRDILHLTDLDWAIESRLDILKRIEKKLNIFIYDHDLELLCKNSRAFDSFLLALAGKIMIDKKNEKLPTWPGLSDANFLVPHF